MFDRIGSYEEFGKCITCTIYGCPDRKEHHQAWWSQNTGFDKLKREEDLDDPIDDFENNKRRGWIEDCKARRVDDKDDDDYFQDADSEDNPDCEYKYSKKTILVNEYIVKVSFYYDVMPSSKHTAKESVYTTDWDKAHQMVLDMYPNSTLIDSCMGEQNIPQEVDD